MDTSIDTLLSQNPSMADGLKAFRQKGKSVIYGLSGSQKSFLLSRAIPEEQVQSIIIVVHDKEHKELWERDLAFFWPNVQVLPFPIIASAVRSLHKAEILKNCLTKHGYSQWVQSWRSFFASSLSLVKTTPLSQAIQSTGTAYPLRISDCLSSSLFT